MFSVIIPVYNRRELVGRAIRSVLLQEGGDYEVIVVDDASGDGTSDWVRATFADRVQLLVLEKNAGVSAARNHGIEAARGEWIALLDSDDEWLPGKLARQATCLAESGLLVCHTDEIWIRDGVRVNPHKHHRKYGGDIFFKALPLCVMSPSSIVIHRDVFAAVGLFDENLPACEDYELWLRIGSRYEVAYLEDKLIRKYGGHADQLSQAHLAMDRFRIYALDKLLRDMPELVVERRAAACEMLLRKARIVHKGAIKHGNEELRGEMDSYLADWE